MDYAKLDDLLVKNHISRRKLAMLAGLSPTTLASAMNNNTQTGLVNDPVYIKRFASILNVPYHELLTEKELSEMQITDDEGNEITVVEDSLNEYASPVRLKIESKLDELNVFGLRKLLEIMEDLAEIPRYQCRTEVKGDD